MVTQVTGTYAGLYSRDNLYAAWRKTAKGKRSRIVAGFRDRVVHDAPWSQPKVPADKPPITCYTTGIRQR